MDDALRKALRSDDWSARASALRRAGEGARARREVARAARSGLADARETLEAEFPLDPDARALLEVLAAPPDSTLRAAWAAQILWGDGDPRLAEAAEAWLDRAIQEGREEGGFGHLLISSYEERIRAFLGSNGPALERAILSGEEGHALLAGISGAPSRLQLLQLCFLGEQSGDSEFLKRVHGLVEAHPQASRILEVVRGPEPSRAGGSLGNEVPWRPAWVRPPLRDGQTLALWRHALRGRHLAPGEHELPACEWVLMFALDDLRGLNDREGMEPANVVLEASVQGVQGQFGDRVVRWLGNRFLIPWDEQDAEERFEACARTLREDLGAVAAISGVLMTKDLADRVPSWASTLEAGLACARERGASLEVLED